MKSILWAQRVNSIKYGNLFYYQLQYFAKILRKEKILSLDKVDDKLTKMQNIS